MSLSRIVFPFHFLVLTRELLAAGAEAAIVSASLAQDLSFMFEGSLIKVRPLLKLLKVKVRTKIYIIPNALQQSLFPLPS